MSDLEQLVDDLAAAGFTGHREPKTRVLIVDALNTLERLTAAGSHGLAMKLALAQLKAAGVTLVTSDDMVPDVDGPLSLEARFDFDAYRARLPDEQPESPRYDKRAMGTRAPRWRSPGEGKPAGSKLAKKAARGKL